MQAKGIRALTHPFATTNVALACTAECNCQYLHQGNQHHASPRGHAYSFAISQGTAFMRSFLSTWSTFEILLPAVLEGHLDWM
jgi:hypothetical protein